MSDAVVLISGFDELPFDDGMTVDTGRNIHGTKVASIIAAQQGNGGMVGVAPAANILPVRVLYPPGVGTGFGVFFGFGDIIRLKKAAIPTNIVAVNCSMAEFLDTELASAAALGAVLVGDLGPQALVSAGMAITFHARARELIATGTALVASAGNSAMDPVLGKFGLQYPASATGAIAVGEVDRSHTPTAESQRPLPWQTVTISAPTGTINPDGSYQDGIKVPDRLNSSPSDYMCWIGTSFAAPEVAGAIAYLVAPPPPYRPFASTGVDAARILVQHVAPASGNSSGAAGAGVLDLRFALAPPPPPDVSLRWSLSFTSPTGRIDDFAFLGTSGDYALRGGGRFLERIVGQSGDAPTFVGAFASPKSWILGLSDVNLLAVGDSSSITIIRPDGSSVGTSSQVSFRPAITPYLGGGTSLIAMSDGAGGVRVRRESQFLSGPDLAIIPGTPGHPIIDARWGGPVTALGRPAKLFSLAVRTEQQVRFIQIDGELAMCATDRTKCPFDLGSAAFPGTAPIPEPSPHFSRQTRP